MKKSMIRESLGSPAYGRGGFTLVEMLIVIGIIGILAATLITSFSHVKNVARQSQAQSLASEVATAFSLYLQRERKWPQEWLDNTEMNDKVCAIFQSKNMLDLTTWKTVPGVSEKGVVDTSSATINKDSLDQFGLLDPWGRSALRRNMKGATKSTKMEGGSTIGDHLIQYRLDENYDGYVDSSEGSPMGLKVRAPVLVWSRGPDGKDDFESNTGHYPKDDRLSWEYGKTRGSK